MSITQQMQTMSAKANELFAKLADTTDGAVKTRDRLLADLKEELEQQTRLEEKHLFPVLRKNPATRDLVAAAADTNKEVRKLLAELDGMPREGSAFADKATELRKLFQRHIRDEKKELLPAVRKALSDDEQQALADTLEAQKAAIQETAKQAAQQTARTVRSGAEAAERTAEAGTDAARTGVRAAATGALKAAGTIDRIAGPARGRMLAMSTAPNVAARAASEAGAAWIAYVNRTASAGSAVAQRLSGCSSARDVAALQGDAMGEAVDAWLDMQNRMLEITMRASRDMVRPLER